MSKMGPLQSGRRRPRDITTQAVDFLNSVNNDVNVSTAPSSFPARQRPSKRPKTHGSGDAIDTPLLSDQNSWRTEDNDTDDDAADPITPRRSALLEARTTTDTPTRRSLRSTRKPAEGIEYAQVREDNDDAVDFLTPRRSVRLETRKKTTGPPARRSLKSTRNSTEKIEDARAMEDNGDGDELFNIRLFSDDTDPEVQHLPNASSRCSSSESESAKLMSPSKLFEGQGISSDVESEVGSDTEQGPGFGDSKQGGSEDDVAGDGGLEAKLPQPSSARQGRESSASPPAQENRNRRGNLLAGHETPRCDFNAEAAENPDASPSSRRRRNKPHQYSDSYVIISPTSLTDCTRNTVSRDISRVQTAEGPSHTSDREDYNVEISSSVSERKRPENFRAYSQAQDEVSGSSNHSNSISSSGTETDTDLVNSESENDSITGIVANNAEDKSFGVSERNGRSIGHAVNNTDVDVDCTGPVNHMNEVNGEYHTVEDTEDGEYLEDWFKEAKDLGGQGGSWNTLIKGAKGLKRAAKPESRKHFEGVITLVSELDKIFHDLPNTSISDRSASRVGSYECHNLLDGISREGFGILVKAWYLAAGDHTSPKRKFRAKYLVDGFEAHVIPEMVKLCLGCFKAYYTDYQLALGGHEQLLGVLRLILSFNNRIFNLKAEGIVETKASARHIRLPLRQIIEALEWGDFERKPTSGRRRPVFVEPEANDEELDDESDNSVSLEMGPERKWTEDEGNTLVRGLRMYQGPNRYVQIVRHFGDRLGGRSLKELQAKAKVIRDKNVPNLEGQLQTRHGRQAFQWLLSV